MKNSIKRHRIEVQRKHGISADESLEESTEEPLEESTEEPLEEYTENQSELRLNLAGHLNNLNGGGNNNNKDEPDESDSKRRFRIVNVNGEDVKIGKVSIGASKPPSNAARKLLKSYAKHKGISKNNRVSLNIVFSIQEITRGSKKKVYGPYSGKYYKYNKEEAEKAQASGVFFKYKPIVKLVKK